MTNRADLGEAEMRWIARFRKEGHRLLNLTDGGDGAHGTKWTEERRERMLKKMVGFNHSDETRALWSKQRRGKRTGPENHLHGRRGAAHPAFGRVWAPESLEKAAVAKRGERNPNFGKSIPPAQKAKMSAAQKGKPKPSSRRSAHTRHHTNMGVASDACKYCVEESAS